jgi:cytochrome c-type biogenesis protein CcmE
MAGSGRAPRWLTLWLLFIALSSVSSVVLALTFGRSEAVYSVEVEELTANPAKWLARSHMRVQGMLVHGTLGRYENSCDFVFRLKSRNSELPVHFAAPRADDGRCVIPDTFCDIPGLDVSATVEGHVEKVAIGLVFAADAIMAKCPSKYEIALDANGRPWRCPPVPIVRDARRSERAE